MEKKKYIPLLTIIEKVPDKRQEAKVLHPLTDIIFIAIVATLAGADDWEAMEDFASLREEWFRKFISLPNGIPSHDTIQRAFEWIPPKILNKCIVEWTQMISEIYKGGIVAIDGKTMRGTNDKQKGKKAIHVVSAWYSENKMVLGQVATDEKSNEITAIPELLEILNITGCIVTVDALGTQKGIAEKVIEKKADYVMALKGNHPLLHEEVKKFFDAIDDPKYMEEYDIKTWESKEKDHGRIDIRKYYYTTKIKWLDARQEWKGLNGLGMVIHKSESQGQVTEEKRYYLGSITEVEEFAKASRRHWGVESMHWSLDVSLKEDSKRTRTNCSPENLAILGRLAYNILKLDTSKKKSLRRKRQEAGWDVKFLESLLANL